MTELTKTKEIGEEIEIKLSLDEYDYMHLQNWLSSSAQFLYQLDQVDIYFNNPDNSWMRIHKEGYRFALKYLRVRITDKGSSVCFKDWETGANKGECGVYCRDVELKISDPISQIALLENIGFSEKTEIRKNRTSYCYRDVLIEIDHSPGLGTFVEFEVRKRKHSLPEDEYEHLRQFIDSLGLRNFKVQKHGFIILAWNPDIDFANNTEI